MIALGKKHKSVAGQGERARRGFKNLSSAASKMPREERDKWLMDQINNIPAHLAGNHEKCAHHAQATTGKALQMTPEAREGLEELLTKYANKAEQFAHGSSSNPNEAINSVINVYCDKRIGTHKNYELYADCAFLHKDIGPR